MHPFQEMLARNDLRPWPIMLMVHDLMHPDSNRWDGKLEPGRQIHIQAAAEWAIRRFITCGMLNCEGPRNELTPTDLLWDWWRNSGGAGGPLDDDTWLNHADLASKLEIPAEPLRKRLDRWRKQHGEVWQEAMEPRAGEPQYVYRVGAIRTLLEKARSSARSSAARPGKKI